jgi:hypothetical protein
MGGRLDGGRASADGAAAWPLDRVLFALAATVTLLGVVLALAVSPWFLVLPAFVGANQLLYVWRGFCPASLVLRRLGVRGGWSSSGDRVREERLA